LEADFLARVAESECCEPPKARILLAEPNIFLLRIATLLVAEPTAFFDPT
jgi:hypothetical protein